MILNYDKLIDQFCKLIDIKKLNELLGQLIYKKMLNVLNSEQYINCKLLIY